MQSGVRHILGSIGHQAETERPINVTAIISSPGVSDCTYQAGSMTSEAVDPTCDLPFLLHSPPLHLTPQLVSVCDLYNSSRMYLRLEDCVGR